MTQLFDETRWPRRTNHWGPTFGMSSLAVGIAAVGRGRDPETAFELAVEFNERFGAESAGDREVGRAIFAWFENALARATPGESAPTTPGATDAPATSLEDRP